MLPTVGYIRYRQGYKYQLARNFEVQTDIRPERDIETEYISLKKNGRLSIREGYAWDGCSGPTRDDATNMRGGLVHDALCQLGRMGLLDACWFDAVNTELRRICREDGMGWFRCWYYFRAVEDFGRAAFAAGNDPYPELVAP